MTVTEDLKKATDSIRAQGKAALADARKPLYVYVGAGEYAVAKLREITAELPGEVDRLRGKAAEMPEQVMGLKGTIETSMSEFQAKVDAMVEELADRGEKFVTGLRGAAATAQDSDAAKQAEALADKAKAQAKRSTTRARAAGTSAKKATQSAAASARQTGRAAAKGGEAVVAEADRQTSAG